jgi:hypothetical protein
LKKNNNGKFSNMDGKVINVEQKISEKLDNQTIATNDKIERMEKRMNEMLNLQHLLLEK